MTARFNFYLKCPRPDLVRGVKTHSDASAITILSCKTKKWKVFNSRKTINGVKFQSFQRLFSLMLVIKWR
ncbi:hypothetical protein I3760_04G174600 [Carya illinoinensis]|nr:hypothetical protein I3760_04G174600 [Carya illinoinensis]